MLEAYTWTQFFSLLAICVVVYYVYIAIFYYGAEITTALFGTSNRAVQPVVETSSVIPSQSDYSKYAPPVQTQTYHLDDDDEDNEQQPSADITDADILRKDQYDWEDTQAFVMDYREPQGEELLLLQQIDVEDEAPNHLIEGGIPADEYVTATAEIQKENIEEDQKELTKAVLRRAYFNTSFVEIHQMNLHARTNMDEILQELKNEGKISASEVVNFNEYVGVEGSEDQDIKALLETFNS